MGGNLAGLVWCLLVETTRLRWLQAVSVDREIEISHWGNVYFEDRYHLVGDRAADAARQAQQMWQDKQSAVWTWHVAWQGRALLHAVSLALPHRAAEAAALTIVAHLRCDVHARHALQKHAGPKVKGEWSRLDYMTNQQHGQNAIREFRVRFMRGGCCHAPPGVVCLNAAGVMWLCCPMFLASWWESEWSKPEPNSIASLAWVCAGLQALMLPSARSLYYRDAIGNISSSGACTVQLYFCVHHRDVLHCQLHCQLCLPHLSAGTGRVPSLVPSLLCHGLHAAARFQSGDVQVGLMPRYPLFGGWSSIFTFGWSLPLEHAVM